MPAALVSSAWQDAARVAQVVAAMARLVTPETGRTQTSWSQAQATLCAVQALWSQVVALQPLILLAPWRAGALGRAQVEAGWGAAGVPSAVAVLVGWRDGDHGGLIVNAGWQPAEPAARRSQSSWNDAERAAGALEAIWRPGYPLVSYGGPWTPPVQPAGPPLPPSPCYQPSAQLRFVDVLRRLTRLLFVCRHSALIRVAPKEVYVISDTSSLVRIDTGDSIPVIGMSISLDRDSWTLGFSASLHASALDLIQPNAGGDPVELLATVNGVEFRVVVESMGRDRVFREVGVRVQGRGRACQLDAPAWPQSTFSNAGAVTSQQLLDAALPAGWTAAWGLEPWLVPAGIWLHQGTPISAALAIAAAGGGYLQTHRTDAVLQVVPQYPLAPWDWATATPDIELPASVMERETIEWVTRPDYNGVYVSGVRDGVLRLVKRAGSAGDLLAPMVTDALITREAAARQRGLPVLCDTGRQAQVGLQLPVLAETGVILPGKLVRYVDGGTTRVGLTRGVRVDVAFGQITQTIKVETHV